MQSYDECHADADGEASLHWRRAGDSNWTKSVDEAHVAESSGAVSSGTKRTLVDHAVADYREMRWWRPGKERYEGTFGCAGWREPYGLADGHKEGLDINAAMEPQNQGDRIHCTRGTDAPEDIFRLAVCTQLYLALRAVACISPPSRRSEHRRRRRQAAHGESEVCISRSRVKIKRHIAQLYTHR